MSKLDEDVMLEMVLSYVFKAMGSRDRKEALQKAVVILNKLLEAST